MAFLAGIHSGAEDDGAHVSEKISQLAAVVTFIGFNFTFFRNLSWHARHAAALCGLSA